MQTGPFRMQSTCSQCGGSGKIVSVCPNLLFNLFSLNLSILEILVSLKRGSFQNFCKSCNGERVVRRLKSVKVDIMPGKSFWFSYNV